jgi:FkbM family methyltransferase
MSDTKLSNHLAQIQKDYDIPTEHVNHLKYLKSTGFEPKVIYDIGSCVLHWTNQAKKLWPDAKFILFDAFSPAEFLYEGYDYHVGVLSDKDDHVVKFYQNDYKPGGNSYYREIGSNNGKYFPENVYIEKKTKRLDTIVKERGFPLPDFVKIDVQGAEVDVISGGVNTIKNASRLIVELQHTEYNLGALTSNKSLPLIESMLNFKCSHPLFTNNGPDGDYGFVNMNKHDKKKVIILNESLNSWSDV